MLSSVRQSIYIMAVTRMRMLPAEDEKKVADFESNCLARGPVPAPTPAKTNHEH
jgi:hypothetical protein